MPESRFGHVAAALSELDRVFALHLHSRSLVNRWFAAHGGWPVRSAVFDNSGSRENIDVLRTLRAVLGKGATTRFADVQPGLPPAVQEEIAESSIRHGQTMLNNRLEEDEILGINHDGSLQSRIVGQPPMFELILSKEPKLTLEVTVLKASTTMQVRTGIPFELLQLVAFAFSHEIYPASARWEPKTALSGEFSSWLEFLAKSPDVEQIKISQSGRLIVVSQAIMIA